MNRATFNSLTIITKKRQINRFALRSFPRANLLAPLLVVVCIVADQACGASTWRKAAEGNFQRAAVTLAATNSETSGWEFARACFDLAEYATNNAERAELARRGMEAAKRVIVRNSNSAPAHYYLGMNVGQMARTKLLGALKLVDDIEREFQNARAIDPKFDYAGPDRNLGLLYRDAPTIGSLGSRRKALIHLQNAVRIDPDYPDNRLNLAESYLKWGDRNGAARELKALDEAWENAQGRLTGPAWESSWADWKARREKVRTRVQEGVKALKSPHDS